MKSQILKPYLKALSEVASYGDAREESYYSALEDLINSFAESSERKDIYVTTLPKKTEAGNPDFRIWDGKQHIVGYMEAKDPSVDLSRAEKTEQLKRYLGTFPNLILTNFLDFRLYRDGQLIDRCSVSHSVGQKLSDAETGEFETDLIRILDKFLIFSLPKVYNAENLALELAKRTRFLRDEVIAEELKEEKENKGVILGFYEAFKQHLMGDIEEWEFADLYSQTITYGLFVARTTEEGEFNRKLAYDRIPKTLGLLRDIFRFISLGDLPPQMEWIIDDISEVLTVTDIKSSFSHLLYEGREVNLVLDFYEPEYDFKKSRDMIFHFYETFLAAYDPETRKHTGSYYTPEPVVAYIVRSLNYLLKDRLKKPDGLADKSVTVLDPAAGTLTFLYAAIMQAIEEFVSKYGKGGKRNFIREHILRNFYAFEIKMAPYAIGHLRISFLMDEQGCKLRNDERFPFYLTNALEMEELHETRIPGMASLSEESHLAAKVKGQQPILVILGNPPYFGRSSNFGEWISREIRAYYEVDGHPLNERNPKGLQDDYVKFIRLAQWKIDQAGEGILGFITNHSYLDNVTFRGMRQSLMNSFDEIYVLNLHGNSLKQEKCPDGSRDDNVFDIMQGVAISIFIKKKGKHEGCKTYYSDLWGLREQKYAKLLQTDIRSTNWTQTEPSKPYYFFIPKDFSYQEVYDKFLKLTDIFVEWNSGVKTHRDQFTIGFSKKEIIEKMQIFAGDSSNDLVKQKLSLKDTQTWKMQFVRDRIRNINWEDHIIKYLYRPFDIRYICYTSHLIDRDRWDLMQNFLAGDNLGIGIKRSRYLKVFEFRHIFVTSMVSDINLYGDQTSYIPLYVYTKQSEEELFGKKNPNIERFPNLNPRFLETIKDKYNPTITPEHIFYYIYAVLYSNIYRKQYVDFLTTDFPRVPFTRDYDVFCRMGELGKRLADLHLMESDELDSPAAKFEGEGDGKVETVKYDNGRVYINRDEYFEGVAKDVWEYYVGGYQVCMKWLKDRKGRNLSLDEIRHYCRIVTALERTIEIQGLIDEVYPEVESGVIAFGLSN